MKNPMEYISNLASKFGRLNKSIYSMTNILVDFAIASVVAIALYVNIFSVDTIINWTALGAFGTVLSVLVPIVIGIALLYALLVVLKSGKGNKKSIYSMTNILVDFAIASVVAIALYVNIFSVDTIINWTALGAFGTVLSVLVPIVIGIALLYALLVVLKSGKGNKKVF